MNRLLLALGVLAVLIAPAVSQVTAAPQGVWVKDPANPVLEPGAGGAWDENGVMRPAVIKDGATYKMWFIGQNAGGEWAVGYATSADGTAWTEHGGNPVMSAGTSGSWTSNGIYGVSVLKNGATYEMWYYAYDDDWYATIGHATSPDGISWTEDPANPVLSSGPSGSYDSSRLILPTVTMVGSEYKMWYLGYDDDWYPGICHATSPDGTNWTKHAGNPVLAPGDEGSWDAEYAGAPSVLYDSGSGVIRMWYDGAGAMGEDGIGYARSADGVSWQRSASNPVLRPDAVSGEEWVGYPTVIQDGAIYEMWYGSPGGGGDSIRHAVAEPGGWITGAVTEEGSTPLPDASVLALDDELNIVASTVAEGDGSYRLIDLPAGEYYITAGADGYGREYYQEAPDLAAATAVTVTVPITTSNISFTLAAGGAISGHVYAPDGATPFDGAMVWTQPAGGGLPASAYSAGDGAYEVSDLATSVHDLWAGYGSYLADAPDTPAAVTQPDTTSDVDLILGEPYLPLQEGTSWLYSWSNDVHHPDDISELIWVASRNSDVVLGAAHQQAHGEFYLGEQAGGISWTGWSTHGGPHLPEWMYMLLKYAYVPREMMVQPLAPGQSWRGYASTGNLPSHEATSALVSVSDTITVAAGVYTDVLRIHTGISGTSTYLSGERDMCFAPGVGLIKLIYHHDDGSMTSAELVGGPYTESIFLPAILSDAVVGPPRVVSTSPADGATGVRRDLPAVTITFNKAMENSWSVLLGGIGDVEVTRDSSMRTFTLTRISGGLLAPNTKYTLTLNPHGPGFRDLAGNPAPTMSFSFTTGN